MCATCAAAPIQRILKLSFGQLTSQAAAERYRPAPKQPVFIVLNTSNGLLIQHATRPHFLDLCFSRQQDSTHCADQVSRHALRDPHTHLLGAETYRAQQPQRTMFAHLRLSFAPFPCCAQLTSHYRLAHPRYYSKSTITHRPTQSPPRHTPSNLICPRGWPESLGNTQSQKKFRRSGIVLQVESAVARWRRKLCSGHTKLEEARRCFSSVWILTDSVVFP
ncbi:hypothetical protein K438DRAFT_230058 [Mycena galopus ATCC 62051]|nr:hypothetical protein K438DRAFT_230058 [Mycena galopus ATCC 62051]